MLEIEKRKWVIILLRILSAFGALAGFICAFNFYGDAFMDTKLFLNRPKEHPCLHDLASLEAKVALIFLLFGIVFLLCFVTTFYIVRKISGVTEPTPL